MKLAFFSIQSALLALPNNEVWIPSHGFLVGVLFVGALLTAGVALAVFSFYEDFYWGDKKFRETLRVHPSRRRA